MGVCNVVLTLTGKESMKYGVPWLSLPEVSPEMVMLVGHAVISGTLVATSTDITMGEHGSVARFEPEAPACCAYFRVKKIFRTNPMSSSCRKRRLYRPSALPATTDGCVGADGGSYDRHPAGHIVQLAGCGGTVLTLQDDALEQLAGHFTHVTL